MRIRPFGAGDLEAVALLWHTAKRQAYPFLPQEQARTVDEDRAFLATRIVPRCALWLAVDDAAVHGFLALEGSTVDRLYVHPDAQRHGFGSALLRHAMALLPAGLGLYTHQRNYGARAFYAKHGLRAVRFGVSPPPEREPDVEYRWRPASASGSMRSRI